MDWPGAPQGNRKHYHKQEEENANDFKQDTAADLAERTQEAAHTPRHAAAGLAGSSPCGAVLGGPRGNWLAQGCAGSRLGAGGHVLARNPPSYPHANAQDAPYGVKFHFDMMVPATVREPLFALSLLFPVAPQTTLEVR